MEALFTTNKFLQKVKKKSNASFSSSLDIRQSHPKQISKLIYLIHFSVYSVYIRSLNHKASTNERINTW